MRRYKYTTGGQLWNGNDSAGNIIGGGVSGAISGLASGDIAGGVTGLLTGFLTAGMEDEKKFNAWQDNIKTGRKLEMMNRGQSYNPYAPTYKCGGRVKKHKMEDGGMINDEDYIDEDSIEQYKSGGWIQSAHLKKGRCTPAPNPDCPKGSKQYALAMRFKHGDLHRKKMPEGGVAGNDDPPKNERQLYTDSLNLYNFGQEQDRYWGKDRTSHLDPKHYNVLLPQHNINLENSGFSRVPVGETTTSYTKTFFANKNIKPISYNNYSFGTRDDKDYSYGNDFIQGIPIYKKPTGNALPKPIQKTPSIMYGNPEFLPELTKLPERNMTQPQPKTRADINLGFLAAGHPEQTIGWYDDEKGNVTHLTGQQLLDMGDKGVELLGKIELGHGTNLVEPYKKILQEKYNKDVAKFKIGGRVMQYANGGQVPVELEKQEVAETPQGETIQFDGPSHEQGGIKTELPENTIVFSDKLKASNGKTFAEIVAQKEKYLEKLQKNYDNNPSTENYNTLMKMKSNVEADKKDLFAQQEAMKPQEVPQKQFADGGQVDDMPLGAGFEQYWENDKEQHYAKGGRVSHTRKWKSGYPQHIKSSGYGGAGRRLFANGGEIPPWEKEYNPLVMADNEYFPIGNPNTKRNAAYDYTPEEEGMTAEDWQRNANEQQARRVAENPIVEKDLPIGSPNTRNNSTSTSEKSTGLNTNSILSGIGTALPIAYNLAMGTQEADQLNPSKYFPKVTYKPQYEGYSNKLNKVAGYYGALKANSNPYTRYMASNAAAEASSDIMSQVDQANKAEFNKYQESLAKNDMLANQIALGIDSGYNPQARAAKDAFTAKGMEQVSALTQRNEMQSNMANRDKQRIMALSKMFPDVTMNKDGSFTYTVNGKAKTITSEQADNLINYGGF